MFLTFEIATKWQMCVTHDDTIGRFFKSANKQIKFIVPTFSDSQTSPTFPIFFAVFQYSSMFSFYLKYGYHICRVFLITGQQISLTFPVFFFIFPVLFFLIFPVFWVKLPDFSLTISVLTKFPDWKRLSRFSRLSSPSRNHEVSNRLKFNAAVSGHYNYPLSNFHST